MAKKPVTLEFKVKDDSSASLRKIQAELAAIETRTQALSAVNKKFAPPDFKQREWAAHAERLRQTFEKPRLSLEAFSKAASKVGAVMGGIGVAMTAGITAPLAGLSKDAIKTSADYEQAINDLRARTNASQEDIAALSSEARRLGTSTTFGATKAVEAMTALGKAGFDTSAIIGGTAGVLNLAAAEAMGMEEAANLVSDTINQFGLAASDATSVADQLAKAAGISSISITDLQYSMKYSAPLAKSFGLSLEQVAGAIATLGSRGVKGETAGTAFRSLLNTLTGDNEKIEKLKKAGIRGEQIFTDKSLTKLRSVPEILDAIAKANLSAAERFDIFGKEFGGTIGILIQNAADVRKQIGEVGNSTGFSLQVAEARTRGFNGAWQRLKNSVEETYISITEGEDGPLSTLTGFLDSIRGLVDGFRNLSPEVQNFILVSAGIAGVVGPILAAFGGFLFMLPGMIAGWTALTAGAGSFAVAMGGVSIAAGPIVGALMLIGGAAAAIYMHWDKLGPFFEALWETIGSLASDWWEQMKWILDGLRRGFNFLSKFVGIKAIPGFDSDQVAGVAQPFDFTARTRGPAFVPSAADAGAAGAIARSPSAYFEPTANQNTRNELFVNFGGQVPPGTTVREGAKNDSEVKLKVGRTMQ